MIFFSSRDVVRIIICILNTLLSTVLHFPRICLALCKEHPGCGRIFCFHDVDFSVDVIFSPKFQIVLKGQKISYAYLGSCKS